MIFIPVCNEKMSNKSCQTDFVKYTEATPLVVTATAVTEDDEIDDDEIDDDDCGLCECCCLCFWYLILGGIVAFILCYYIPI